MWWGERKSAEKDNEKSLNASYLKKYKKEDINLDFINKAISDYLESRDKETDIVIETEEPSYFACSIQSNNHKLNTGIGGFKMFLSNLPNLDMLKVSFNGIILNQKEKQELYAKYRR